MKITVDLPDDVAVRPNPGREALEALAIEGYWTALVSISGHGEWPAPGPRAGQPMSGVSGLAPPSLIWKSKRRGSLDLPRGKTGLEQDAPQARGFRSLEGHNSHGLIRTTRDESTCLLCLLNQWLACHERRGFRVF